MDKETLKANIRCAYCENKYGSQVKLYTLHLSPGHFFHTDRPEKFRKLKCEVKKYGKFYQVDNQLRIAVDNGITEGVKRYLNEALVFSHHTDPPFVPYISVQYCCRNDYGRIFNGEKTISRDDYRIYYSFLYFIVIGESLKNICGDMRSRITKYMLPHFDDFYDFALNAMGDNWEKMYEKKISGYKWWDIVCNI